MKRVVLRKSLAFAMISASESFGASAGASFGGLTRFPDCRSRGASSASECADTPREAAPASRARREINISPQAVVRTGGLQKRSSGATSVLARGGEKECSRKRFKNPILLIV